MQKLKIVGGSRLVGQVRASGAKNAALPILAASLLTSDEVILHNMPDLADVRTMGRLLAGMGVSFARLDADTVRLKADAVTSTEAPYDLVKTMRASIMVLGPLSRVSGRHGFLFPEGAPSELAPSTNTSRP